MSLKAFSELCVVELAGSMAGAYCAKLFADHGARVVLVGADRLSEAQRLHVHRGKERLVDAAGPEAVDLMRRADLIIESSADRPLPPAPPTPAGSSESVGQAGSDRGPIRLRISPYGSTGPCAGWSATELTGYAHSGQLYLTGDPDREPLCHPRNHPPVVAGLFGFIGAMGALLDSARHDRHRDVEVATHEVLVALHQLTFMRYLLGRDVLARMGNRYTGQGEPNGLLRCSDGWVAVSAPTEPQVEMLLLVTGLSHLLDHPDIGSSMDFQTHPAILYEALDPWLAQHSMAEITELFQSVRIPTAPARPLLGLLEDDQLAARDFWLDVDGIKIPRSPLLFGEPSGHRSPLRHDLPDTGPLSGVRVLDLCKVWAGPLAARTLAELGADVIQVEAPWGRGPQELPESLVWAQRFHPDNVQGPHQWNRNGHLIKYGLHKRSVVLDLTRPEGVEAFERLVPEVDVVMENYSPRVMPQLGLDEHRLHELNPALVYMTMPGYGRSGPARDWVAYGTTVDSHAGLSHLIGYPGQAPWKNGVAWPDPIAGLHAASAILIALWRRSEVGGVTIESAQFEATVASIGDSLVEAQLRGADSDPIGNRHPDHAPQGVYPCAGEDRWIALAVLDEQSWTSLCAAAGLGADRAAQDLADRRADHDAIDAELAAWTSAQEPLALAELLQAQGVAAAPVLDAPGVLADRQLQDRGAFVQLEQPEVGPITSTRMPIHFSGVEKRPPLRHAALLGEDNEAVLCDLAGLSAIECDALIAAGIVATEPPE